MTAILSARNPAAPERGPIVLTLAWLEARRMLRSPWLLVAVLLTIWLWFDWASQSDWPGQRYIEMQMPVTPIQLAAGIVVALSFHRERAGLATDAPVGEVERCLARLLGGLVFVGLAALVVAAVTAHIWFAGGLDLGHDPGRTLHAHPTVPELLQPLLMTVLAIAVGAAAGRRLRYLATAVLLVFVAWFVTTTGYWLFTSPWVAPFSIVQVQPVSVDLGAGAPLGGLPDTWLLSAPNRVNGQPHWEHLVVSEPLAWWHNGWLVGLSLLVVSLAFPASWRRPLAIAGAFLASLAVVAEFVVYPS